MKTKNKFIAMALIAIMGIAFIGCGGNDDSSQEKPKKHPDTPRTLSFGTDCKVTIKSNDLFLTAEWTALCNSVVAAIERGYNSQGEGGKIGTENYFTGHTVTVDLLKSATKDFEVKDSVPGTIYFKANGSSIDGIPNEELSYVLLALSGVASYPTP